MQDAVCNFVAHGYARRAKLIEYLLVASISSAGARVAQYANRHSGLMPCDELVGERCVLYEPEGHVNADRFVVYEIP